MKRARVIYLVFLLVALNISYSQSKMKPNVLFIIVDDMNNDIGTFGGPILTPNVDKLAKSGMQFNKAYVQQPVCSASRASFLSGLRPSTTGVEYPYSYYYVEEVLKKQPTMSDHFANHGYNVKHYGKVHHNLKENHPTYIPKKSGRYETDSLNIAEKKYGKGSQPPYEITKGEPKDYHDYRVAQKVIADLNTVDASKPFFFVAGFKKPHLPFSAPQKYWDLYDEDAISLPALKTRNQGSPPYAIENYTLTQYKWEHADKNRPFSDDYIKKMRHAYYASMSFVDDQVGALLAALEKNNLKENTIVLFVSDHGFMLGDHMHWSKTNLFEKTARVPLFVSWEGHIQPSLTTDALVEAVDIYPVLADLANLPIPEFLEGTSFKPIINNPELPWKKGVFTEQPRGFNHLNGVAMRTEQYRYISWFDMGNNNKVVFEELYDYEKDATEAVNLINDPEYKEVRKTLSKQLQEGWKSVLPKGITNMSNNPVAPYPYAFGDEGAYWRKKWHEKYGGNEADGWRKALEVKNQWELNHK